MELKVKDVAKLLSLSDKAIYRMIQSETIPCLKLGGQWRFNKDEVLTWSEDAKDLATISNEDESLVIQDGKIFLTGLLKAGGIYYRICGSSKEEVLIEAITLLQSGTQQMYIDNLITATLEREKLCSTAIGHGIALPHIRPFKGFSNQLPFISLFFMEKSIPFGAMDGEDVSILFFISPVTQVRFLRLQAKLMAALRDENIRTKLKEIPLRKEIYELFSSREQENNTHTKKPQTKSLRPTKVIK